MVSTGKTARSKVRGLPTILDSFNVDCGQHFGDLMNSLQSNQNLPIFSMPVVQIEQVGWKPI